METVEDFVVSVTAYFILPVDKSAVYAVRRNEFGNISLVLQKYAFESFELGTLFPEDADLVSVEHFSSDVFGKKFEILVEYRLRTYAEGHRNNSGSGNRNFKKNPAKSLKS